MSTYRLYCIHAKDSDGQFTVDLSDTYEKLSLSQADADAQNQRAGIRMYNKKTGYTDWLESDKYHLCRFKDPAWREREESRFDDGDYERLPWDLELIPDHFAHVSVDKQAMVAFTENEAKGMLDIQTRMKPGRYLQKFYPHLDGDTIRSLACKLDKANEVRFAVTADEIETVYLNGPDSCMSKDPSCYRSPFHPVRVYAAGDLQLAYLSCRELNDENFRASARALVWPEKKIFCRIYGDEDRLRPALEELGYSEGKLPGARLTRHEHNGAFVCPYIDWTSTIDDRGDHLVIGGDIKADNQNGLSDEPEPEGQYCPYLDEYVDEDEEFHYIHDVGESWSETAVEGGAAFYCEGYNRYYSTRNHSYYAMSNGETWSDDYFEMHGVMCEKTDDAIPIEDAVWLEDDEIHVSRQWAKQHAHYDAESSKWYATKPDDEEEEEEEESDEHELEAA